MNPRHPSPQSWCLAIHPAIILYYASDYLTTNGFIEWLSSYPLVIVAWQAVLTYAPINFIPFQFFKWLHLISFFVKNDEFVDGRFFKHFFCQAAAEEENSSAFEDFLIASKFCSALRTKVSEILSEKWTFINVCSNWRMALMSKYIKFLKKV